MILVTFNVRREFQEDLENRFENRKELILKTINHRHPDVIGFQEVLPEALLWLKESLTDYAVVGTGRDPDLGDEATAIAFDKNKYELIKMDTVWLSETPYVPGSRYADQSECPRTCTSVLLYERSSGLIIRVYNTHLDHIGVNARLEAVKQILEMKNNEKLFKDAPFILMGDFNAVPRDEEIKYISDNSDLKDLTANLPGTFHDFGQLDNPEKIDYIYGNNLIKLVDAGLWTCDKESGFISDHFPAFVEISTK